LSDRRFAKIIESESELREVVGKPGNAVTAKTIDHLDEHCRTFIQSSPFMLVASSDSSGNVDVSPKGDPRGFVQVLDEKTLAIPDRPGNRRADTFSNVVQHPSVGLIFLVPGMQETLRVSGQAQLVVDQELLDSMQERGRAPALAMVVHVEEVFFHCAKCIIRSSLWNSESWGSTSGLPTLAETMVDHGGLEMSVEELGAAIEKDARDRLY
jgi:PPOX class probable FMN-dependent enzyme